MRFFYQNHVNKLAHYSELLTETDQLKEENNRLKEEICNKLILEEEVYDLRTRITKLKEMEKKYSELQVSVVLHFNLISVYLITYLITFS